MIALLFPYIVGLLSVIADVSPAIDPPIEIDSCSYVHNEDETRFGYRLSFVNTSNVPATMVRIRVSWKGMAPTQYLRDVGSFSPNVEIDHAFPAPRVMSNPPTCSLDSVKFTDGSIWKASFELQ